MRRQTRHISRKDKRRLSKSFLGKSLKSYMKIQFAMMIGSVVICHAANFATSVAMEFGWNPSISQESVQDVSGQVGDIASNGDYSSPESIDQMVSDITDKAETFANENGTEFHRASVVQVVDGDTIVIDICGERCEDKTHEYTVRLIGVNTPESVASEEYLEYKGTTNSQEGKDASDYTKELLSNVDYVYLESDVDEHDKYGRNLYYVWFEVPENEYDINVISTEMLNGVLVKEGYAEVATYEPNVKYEDYFEAIEDMSK
jgi:micrococcal nuclease